MAKILVIDDEPAIRQLLKLQLEKAAHQVSEAVDGIEGLEAARTQRPDLIFLDVMIPRLDGWQVCREIKKTMSVPIVMLTSLTDTIEEMRGWESGADDYIGKPWTPTQLSEATARLLGKNSRPKPI